MKLPFLKPKPKPVKTTKPPEVVFRKRRNEVRLKDWRRRDDLVSGARSVLASEAVQHMLDCLETEHPANYGLPMGADINVRAMYQALCEGYSRCLNNIQAMGQPVEEMLVPDPDYSTTETETENQ